MEAILGIERRVWERVHLRPAEPRDFTDDGGLWANNPAIVGYVEAMKISTVCRRPNLDPLFGPEDIYMLSVGTGEPRYYAKPGPTDDGLLPAQLIISAGYAASYKIGWRLNGNYPSKTAGFALELSLFWASNCRPSHVTWRILMRSVSHTRHSPALLVRPSA